MDTNPLISVIVPVYNAGECLRRCLDSIASQTHSNIEVILIDDGSTDGSGAICDGQAARDPRFRVIHQQNAGQSAARNAGLDIARGEYIGFVDSDDWVEPDLLEYLLGGMRTQAQTQAASPCAETAARPATRDKQDAETTARPVTRDEHNTETANVSKNTDSKDDTGNNNNNNSNNTNNAVLASPDIVCCSFAQELPGGRHRVRGFDEPAVLDRHAAIGELLLEYRIQDGFWGKLFRRELFDELRFPVGVRHEDRALMWKVFSACQCVCCLPGVKYHYRYNPAGTVNNDSLQYCIDFWEAAKERRDGLIGVYPEYNALLVSSMVRAAMEAWPRAWVNRRSITAGQDKALTEMAAFCRLHCREALKAGVFGRTGRPRVLLTPYKTRWAFFISHLLRRLSTAYSVRCK